MDPIVLLGIFLFGFFLGKQWILYQIYRETIVIAKHLGISTESMDSQESRTCKIPVCTIEEENSTFLLYDLRTRTFMCQGHTIEEVADNLFKHKHVKLAYVGFNKQKFWFVNGAVKSDEDLRLQDANIT